MKNKIYFVLIAIAIISLLTAPCFAANEFPDMKDHWAASSVKALTEKNIIAGWDGLFHPNDQVKANEYIKMVVTALGFIDIENYPGDWARNYIEKALSLDLILPGEIKSFTEPINRGMMAKIAMRALQDEEVPDYIMAYKGLVSDYNDLNANIRLDALKCIEKGIIKGMPDGSFMPEYNSTRAEAATVIHRMISQEEREKAKTIFAVPDPEFEAFMASEEALRYCSIEYGKPLYKVIDGKIIFDNNGETLLMSWHNKDANKEVYNIVRNSVNYARKNENHVRLHLSSDSDVLFIDYHENEFFGLNKPGLDGGNISLIMELKPYKANEKQKEYTFYKWKISNLARQDTDDWESINYKDKDLLGAAEIMLKSIYGDDLGRKIFEYAIAEYDMERDMYFDKNERYVNESVEYREDLGGLEIVNNNGAGMRIDFNTNK